MIVGTAPVAQMRDYQNQVVSYTRGTGRLFCSLKGYVPCKNQEEIVEAIGYDSERDLENPTGSVFCSHGAGFVVPWYEVDEYAHLNTGLSFETDFEDDIDEDSSVSQSVPPSGQRKSQRSSYGGSYEDDKELQAIFERTFGPVKRERNAFQKRVVHASPDYGKYTPKKKSKEEYLLVDGYNIVFAWEELKELAEADIHAACDKLMDILSDYQGYKKCTLILVFDAYKVEGHAEEVIPYHNIYVVYTKEAETADAYIEKLTHRISKNYQVTVATSDGLVQLITRGQNCIVMSAKELKEEIERVNASIREYLAETNSENS